VLTIGIALTVIGVILGLALRPSQLPALALILTCVWPAGSFSHYPALWGTRFTPAIAVMIIWAVKQKKLPGERLIPLWLTTILIALPAALFAVNLTFPGLQRSLGWLIVAFICLGLPILLSPAGSDEETRENLTTALLGITWFLGFLGLVQALLEWDTLAQFWTIRQHWSVFRITTLLGHPLINGLFFAGTTLFWTAKSAINPRKYLAVLIMSGTALMLTGSRSGLLAAAVGALVIVAWLIGTRSISADRRFTMIGLIVGLSLFIFLLFQLGLISSRSGTEEGDSSAAVRSQLFSLVALLHTNPIWGAGAGDSAVLFTRVSDLPLENGFLGNYVSMGWMGVVWISLSFIALAAGCIRGSNIGGAAMIVAMAVAGAGFPSWEHTPALLILTSCAFLITPPLGSSKTLSYVVHEPATARAPRPSLVRQ
jgi:hypothetical protein